MVTRIARSVRFARPAAVLAILLAAAAARADNRHLADARRAIAAVDYDAARRLLVEALHDGGNSPAAVREIYRLSARAAVVLGQTDLAEQYYRRWLAIDAEAALPDDTAPKLREPFIAAEAYIAAHGRVRVRARRLADGTIDVDLLSDPLAMAQAAVALAGGELAGASVPFDADHHARLPASATHIAVVDDRDNHLLELEPEAGAADPGAATAGSTAAGSQPGAPLPRAGAAADATTDPTAAAASPSGPTAEAPPRSRRWMYWGIPTGIFALGAAGFGIAAVASYDRAHQLTTDSSKSFLADAEDNVRRGRTFVWITIGAGAAMAICAVPTAIYFFGDRSRGDDRRAAIIPTVAPGRVGLALGGRF